MRIRLKIVPLAAYLAALVIFLPCRAAGAMPEGAGSLRAVAESPLPAGDILCLARVAEEWLGYYGLDMDQALYEGEGQFDIRETAPPGSLHNRPYNSYYSGEDFCGPDYSPDRARFVDLGCWGCEPDGVLQAEWDDSQDIYIVDRRQEIITLVQWFGTGAKADAAFWLDNDSFAIAGYRSSYSVRDDEDRQAFIEEMHHFISVYDITDGTVRTLIFLNGKEGQPEYWGYVDEVALPAKQAESCSCRVYPIS